MSYISPNKTLPLASKTIRAGEYHAIGYDMQGLSQQQLEATKAQLEQTKSKLESQQETQLASLTKHDITGAMLQAGVQSYFALNDAQDRIAQANTTIIQTPFMSFGTFSTYIQPKQWILSILLVFLYYFYKFKEKPVPIKMMRILMVFSLFFVVTYMVIKKML